MVDEGTQLRLQEFVVSPVTDDAQSLRIDTIPQRVEQELAVFQPGTSGYVGDAAVFGVRGASQWAFYAVIGSTKNPPIVKIWPG